MDLDFLLGVGVTLLIASYTNSMDAHPIVVRLIGGVFLLVTFSIKYVRETNKPRPLKIYENFMKDMKNEGRKLKLAVMPQHSKGYYKILNLFKNCASNRLPF